MNAIISALFTVTLAMLSCHAHANTDLLRFEISATIKRISDDGYVVVQIGNIEEWVKPYGIDEEALNKLVLQEEKPEKAILSYDDIHGSVLTIPSIINS
ncbi:hypothetical protein [Vibrio ezurae]|uniref:Uncharacterized protein n=1 Tax=Vibrio ezurae NBRC 102218 TaxID=1219080 RepID=U3AMV5_9VIBR|nr:hypothetical protein [Vibrio ezurae]GAD81246.1 hypothetical protein VEZ01S_53_00460 [Vibrio ezurae NBRC 102218]